MDITAIWDVTPFSLVDISRSTRHNIQENNNLMRVRKAVCLVMTASLSICPSPYGAERPLPKVFSDILYLLPKRMLKYMELTT
jgi:hypothetical protein